MNSAGPPRTVSETGRLYGDIWDRFDERQWAKFSDDHFFDWSALPVDNDSFFRGKVCLDAGCGSGRAVRSFLLAGAQKVCAIDVGPGCVRNTRKRNAAQADRLEVVRASVLDIPYPDATFDFVHCDGVLHHTTDPYRGFRELLRVLAPGGTIVFSVYGRGGLMNLAIDLARAFNRIIPERVTYRIIRTLSRNPVTWYVVLDSMYVPIRRRYREDDIRGWLSGTDLTDVRRLESAWGPYRFGRWMKGEGYLKFIAQKTSA